MFLSFVAHVSAPIFGPVLHLSNLSSFWGAAQNSVRQAIDVALIANAKADPGVEYDVVATALGTAVVYSVIPRRWQNASGGVRDADSLLYRRATIESKADESAFETIKRFLGEALKGSTYEEKIFPPRAFGKEPIRLSATNDTILSVFNRLLCNDDFLDSNGYKRSWYLIHRPPEGSLSGSTEFLTSMVGSSPEDIDRFVVSDTRRPVAEALRLMAPVLGRSIGHEEPELINNGIIRGIGGKKFFPKGEYLKFGYSSAWLTEHVLEKMLCNLRVDNCDFRVLASDEMYCVVPNKRYNFGTKTNVECQVISTTKVSFLADNSNAMDILKDICVQLSYASKRTVMLSSQSAKVLQNMKTSFRSDGLPCWAALTKYLYACSRSLNWTLLYDPAIDCFVLDIYDWTKPVVIMGGGPSQPAEADQGTGEVSRTMTP